MPTMRNGSIHLFRLSGIDIFLHWSWFLVAMYEIESGSSRYTSVGWGVAEYLSLFLIVLMHELGHSFACRQVGGTAIRIVLWPLGGVAYVDPPQRPGAMLWSIAAGPLVNAALWPVFGVALMAARSQGWAQTMPDAYTLLHSLLWINGGLMIFNLLPVYPLDGGKILRSLLWFPLGRARSLMAVTVLGILGIVGFIVLAAVTGSIWYGVMSLYMLMSCWGGLKQARALLKREKLPRRQGFACPSCHTAPPLGALWKCGKCQQQFDTFESRGVCPNCQAQYQTTSCGDCGKSHPMTEWVVGSIAQIGVLNGGVPAK
jgi:Zn-dependent protease